MQKVSKSRRRARRFIRAHALRCVGSKYAYLILPGVARPVR